MTKNYLALLGTLLFSSLYFWRLKSVGGSPRRWFNFIFFVIALIVIVVITIMGIPFDSFFDTSQSYH